MTVSPGDPEIYSINALKKLDHTMRHREWQLENLTGVATRWNTH